MYPANPAYVSRRSVLQAGAAATGAVLMHAAGLESLSAAPGPTPGKYIDAHVHVWTPDVKAYPLAEGFTVDQMKPPSFTPEELLAQAQPCGVNRIVLIQMSFYRFDNSYMLDTMRRFPGVFSGVGIVDEQAGDPTSTMKKLAAQGVRGFRIHPGQREIEPWISSPGMAAMWKCGASDNLAMCGLINPNALAAFDRMCEKYPDTPVVIDHYARIGVDGTIRDEDLQNLCRLARHKKTYVKVSAYYALGKKKSPYLDLAPMTRRLYDAFGPERLMWATDCPYQVQEGHTYRDSVELIEKRFEFLSASDREWLLTKTAEKVFFG